MKNLLPIFILVILLNGCATTSGYRNVVQSWIGHDFNELTNEWGYPTGSFDTPEGKKYTFITGGGNVNYNSYYSPTRICQTTFTVDISNTIIRGEWRGNACTHY